MFQETSGTAMLVSILGEIWDRERALKEIFGALKPGGVFSITEIIFDPHFQSRGKVIEMAESVGFWQKAFWGGRFTYTLRMEKSGIWLGESESMGLVDRITGLAG